MAERRAAAPPPAWLTFFENRAVGELGAFLAATPALRLVGRGDRHPVLVLPGFTASDRSTEPLRWYLRGLGYWAHGWQLGQNLGPTTRVVEGLDARLRELHDRHGRRVSLIGWSLGGIYARHLARTHPGLVRSVITMGSPFRLRPGDRTAVDRIWDATAVPGRRQVIATVRAEHDDETPLPVPSTAIYSRGDGVVSWWLCLETDSPTAESVEVRGSHTGLGVNPAVLYTVADRLAQPEGRWQRFTPPLPLRPWYPSPRSWAPRPPTRADAPAGSRP